jgi:LAO/AO transport system kinase
LAERRRRNLRSEVISICTHRMRRDLEKRVDGDESFSKLFDAVVERKLDPASAASEILEQLGD